MPDWPPLAEIFRTGSIPTYLDVIAYDTNIPLVLRIPVTESLFDIIQQLRAPGQPLPDPELPIFFREGPVDLHFLYTKAIGITNEALVGIISCFYWLTEFKGPRGVETKILDKEEWDREDYETTGVVQLTIRVEG